MNENRHADSAKLFFQNFANHLRHMRDKGDDAGQAYRAQILLSQLQLFEKAILEYGGGDDGASQRALQILFQIRDMDGLAHWLHHQQKNLAVACVCYLDEQSQWSRLSGEYDGDIQVGEWLERGVAARMDNDQGILLYLRGEPRLALIFANEEEHEPALLSAFGGFVARFASLMVHSAVRGERIVELDTSGLIAHDPTFLQVLAKVERAAEKDVTILLEGESGSGKEVLADFIHRCSERSEKPFVAVNCAAIPAGLIESELFGHEKGAFTNAISRHIGSVERANGGTLFLDEIGEMEISMQAKLLRFLQLREFHRVGGRHKISVDVRIIAATNRNLKTDIGKGLFREDLYYRLSVMPFRVPPLRERVADIVPLARYFLDKYARQFRMPAPTVDDQVFRLLAAYDFPGNIRELENLIQNILVLSQGDIEPSHLPETIRDREPRGDLLLDEEGQVRTWKQQTARRMKLALKPSGGEERPWETHIPRNNGELKDMKQLIQDFAKDQTIELERRFLEHLIERAEGSIHEASQLGEINRTLLYKMIERTGMKM